MITKSVEVVELDDDYVKAPCGNCKTVTKSKILSRVSLEGREYSDEELLIGWSDTMEIIQCQGCEELLFKKSHTNSEDVYYTAEDKGYEQHVVTTEEYFPNPEENRVGIEDDYLLPANLRRIYVETVKALNENSPVLAGVGIRAIVETVCNDKLGANTLGLYDKINELVKLEVLSKAGAEILHKVRTLGNLAAHEVEPHSNASLSLAMDVVEHLIQGVYILPHYAKKHLK